MGRPLGSRNAEHTESRGLSASARACCRWPPSFSVCSEAEGFFGSTTNLFKNGLNQLLGTFDATVAKQGHGSVHNGDHTNHSTGVELTGTTQRNDEVRSPNLCGVTGLSDVLGHGFRKG